MGATVNSDLVYGIEMTPEVLDSLPGEYRERYGADVRYYPPGNLQDAQVLVSENPSTYCTVWYVKESRRKITSSWRWGKEGPIMSLTPDMHHPTTIKIYNHMLQGDFQTIGAPVPALAGWKIVTGFSY